MNNIDAFFASHLTIGEIARRSGVSVEAVWSLCHPGPYFSDERVLFQKIAKEVSKYRDPSTFKRRKCAECGGKMEPRRLKFCSKKCSKMAWDRKNRRKSA